MFLNISGHTKDYFEILTGWLSFKDIFVVSQMCNYCHSWNKSLLSLNWNQKAHHVKVLSFLFFVTQLERLIFPLKDSDSYKRKEKSRIPRWSVLNFNLIFDMHCHTLSVFHISFPDIQPLSTSGFHHRLVMFGTLIGQQIIISSSTAYIPRKGILFANSHRGSIARQQMSR